MRIVCSARARRSAPERTRGGARAPDVGSREDHQPHAFLRLQRTIGNRGVQRMQAGLVQRQPASLDTGPIGDPMTFIETQLARRFDDPDDARLTVRVRRLQDAVETLSRPQAKRLLDRLRANQTTDALARNFQKLATPSRQKLLTALRNRLPSEIEGKRLGTITAGAGAAPIALPLIAAAEIVPSTEEPGSFAGYFDASAAREVGVRRPTITAIVNDKRMGRFRVFETGVATLRQSVPFSVAAAETGLDYVVADWVNLQGDPLPDPAERAARIEEATKLRDAFLKTYERRMGGDDPARDAALQRVRQAYQALVEEAIPFASGRINVSFELDYRDRSMQLHRVTTAQPSMINVDLTGRYAGGFQTALDPMSEIPGLPGARTRTTVRDLFTDQPGISYEPYIALTTVSITEDPLQTRMTLLHEEAHLEHDVRTIALYEDWRLSGSGLAFDAWVRQQTAARRVSDVDAALAIEAAGPRALGFLPNTELLAEVEGFMGGYHAATSAQSRTRFLDRLAVMGHRWSFADQVVQELAMRKFRYYYEHTLQAPQRQVFDEFVLEALGNLKAPVEFYVELVEFSEGG
jgi:hypothetical protein